MVTFTSVFFDIIGTLKTVRVKKPHPTTGEIYRQLFGFNQVQHVKQQTASSPNHITLNPSFSITLLEPEIDETDN
jgi:hypothetical protein